MAEILKQDLMNEMTVTKATRTDSVNPSPAAGGSSLLQLAEWSDRLELGVPQIDAQHRKFFELAASFNGQDDEVRVMKTLAILSEYIRRHFRDEEDLMAACHYPGRQTHCAQHAHFRHMLADLFARARKMSLDEIADEVRYLINGWFFHHIIKVDFEYAPYVVPEQEARRHRSFG
jgi:hemerythrin-like metal-binding protein